MSTSSSTSMSMIEPPPTFDINDFFYNRRQTMSAIKEHPTLLFVRPIPKNMNIEHLYDVFSVYGIVDDITIRSGKYGYSDYATVYMRDWFYLYANTRKNICDGNVCIIRYGSHPAAILHVALYRPNPKQCDRLLQIPENTISSASVPKYLSTEGVSSLSNSYSKPPERKYKEERQIMLDYQGGIGMIPPKQKKKRINWPPATTHENQ